MLGLGLVGTVYSPHLLFSGKNRRVCSKSRDTLLARSVQDYLHPLQPPFPLLWYKIGSER